MSQFTINAIKLEPISSNDYKKIVAVRGADASGIVKTYLLPGIIQIIEIGIPVYVIRNGYKTAVEVVTEGGTKYIRTKGDSTTVNNLLQLPRF